jgi:hypothetical protein
MSKKPPIHTVPHGDRWANRREGNERVTETFDTQREARSAGRDAAQRDGTEHFVHGRSGRIRERNSYGNDPYPPPG